MTNNKLEQFRLNFSRFANYDVKKAPLSSNNTCKTDRILIFFHLLFVDWSRWRKSFTSLLALLRLLKISTFPKNLPLRSTSIGRLRERYCISHLIVNSYPSRCFWVGVWLHSLFTRSQFSYNGLSSSSRSNFYSGGCLVYTVLPWNTSFCCVCFFVFFALSWSYFLRCLLHWCFHLENLTSVADCNGNVFHYGNCLLLLAEQGVAWNFCCGIQLW